MNFSPEVRNAEWSGAIFPLGLGHSLKGIPQSYAFYLS